MAKYPPKCPDNQFNQRTRIHCYVIYNRPKNIQQQSSWKTERIEVNDIMEKLESWMETDTKEKNINHFSPLYESDN